MKFVNAVINGSSFFVDGKRLLLSFYAHAFMKSKDDIPLLNRLLIYHVLFSFKKKSFCLSYTKYYESQSSRRIVHNVWWL